MKRLLYMVVAAVAVLLAPAAWAYDFAEAVPSGQTLYFSIVEGGVEVVYPNSSALPAQGWAGYTMPTGQLTIPATIEHDGTTYTVLAVSNHALYHCASLTSITVDEGIRAVRANAFNGCTALQQASLPASLDTLGAAVFSNCTALTTITMRGATPPAYTASAFSGLDVSTLTLTLPCLAAEAYGAATPWSQFGAIDEEGCQATITATANHPLRGSVAGGGMYPAGEQITLSATASSGCFFACWNDGDTLNPRPLTVQGNAEYVAYFFPMVHDTITAIAVHTDTVVITLHDTVNAIAVHSDTVVITLHDTITAIAVHNDTITITLHDTITAIAVHTDTVTITQHDTVYQTIHLPAADTLWQHDTVAVHDTIYQTIQLPAADTLWLHDTMAVHDTVYQAIYLPMTDTVWLRDTVIAHDTLVPTYFRLTVAATDGGIGIGSTIAPAGTDIEVGALPLEGHRFLQWNDGSDENPRQVHLTGNTTITAQFEALGVLGIDPVEWKAYAVGRRLTVCSPEGLEVSIYDMQGRCLLRHTATAPQTVAIVPSAGTYLVSVAGCAARRVVVIGHQIDN